MEEKRGGRRRGGGGGRAAPADSSSSSMIESTWRTCGLPLGFRLCSPEWEAAGGRTPPSSPLSGWPALRESRSRSKRSCLYTCGHGGLALGVDRGSAAVMTHLHGLETVGSERDLHGSTRAHELVELLLELFVLLGGEGRRRGGEAGERGSEGNEGAGAPRSLPGPALG